MEQILKEYITTLREETLLKERKKELIRQLLHSKLPDGREIADIILDDRCYVRELIMENMPEDASDDELYMKSHTIRDELYFAEYDKHPDLIAQDNARFCIGGYSNGMSACEAKAFEERTM